MIKALKDKQIQIYCDAPPISSARQRWKRKCVNAKYHPKSAHFENVWNIIKNPNSYVNGHFFQYPIRLFIVMLPWNFRKYQSIKNARLFNIPYQHCFWDTCYMLEGSGNFKRRYRIPSLLIGNRCTNVSDPRNSTNWKCVIGNTFSTCIWTHLLLVWCHHVLREVISNNRGTFLNYF